MNPEIVSRVAKMLSLEKGYSRNRYFDEFSEGEGRQAMRLYRLCSSLLQELEEAAARPEVRVSTSLVPGGMQLVIEDPKVSYRRICLVPQPLVGHMERRLVLLGIKAPAGGDGVSK